MTRSSRFRVASLWRASMARRIFVWFGVVIAATTIAVMTTSYALYLGGVTPSWKHEMKRGERLIARQFTHAWHDHERRDRLLDDIHESLGAYVRLEDHLGDQVAARGDEGCCHQTMMAPIEDPQGRIVGHVVICPVRDFSRAWIKLSVTILVVTLVVWILAWLVARSLGQPLGELAHVARRLGHGELSSRARVAGQAGGEITILAEALNEMAERLEQHMREQRTLLAAVSHELRTPLGHMRLLAELGHPHGLSPKHLIELEREIVEIDELVDQLLATSRLNFNLRETRPIDLTAMIIEGVERAGLDLTVIDIEDEGQILGDPTLLRRALANLLRNAQEHGMGVTRVGAKRRGDRILLLVEDNGPGLPQDEREQLFEPFVQTPSGAHATGRGTLGLGLFLVRRIAMAHDAEIIAHDLPQGGACVGLGFALAPSASPAAQGPLPKDSTATA